MEIRHVAVVGSGTMGRGIATAIAVSGYQVTLYDIADQLLANALRSISSFIDKGRERGKISDEAAEKAKESLETTTDLAGVARADLIIEAIPEDLQLKKELFVSLSNQAAEQTILASNTSSLSINALAGSSGRPDRFVGLHFFNPAHIMRLVEVVRGDDTSAETMAAVDAFVASVGKTAVHCTDTPAFIVNRVARPFYGEALRLLGENDLSARAIDRLVRSMGFRMGPFELIDLVGSDVNLAVTRSVYEQFFQDPKYRPHPLQQRMVASGRLGRKSGRGFYTYDDDK
jgi:3-hydroxybutyryl-CoA dehydrogenase